MIYCFLSFQTKSVYFFSVNFLYSHCPFGVALESLVNTAEFGTRVFI